MNGSLAFTWSPNPKIFRGIKPLYQLHDTIQFIDNLKLCCSSYEIYPELNLNGNIHYHGRIELKDKVKWYKKVLPSFKYNGFVVIKDKTNSGWDDYIRKDNKSMQEILGIEIPITKPMRGRLPDEDKSSGTLLDYGIEIVPPLSTTDL